ncbi:Lrp/AsnC family transcriptional regulator [Vreelandella titanicae]|uniref:Lrp/AsnC family transcriptional regulator n=1 Tax=Vreelandella titanicae TaxID=664683 RepID=UPI003D2DC4F7
MEDSGVIRRFAALVEPSLVGQPLSALVMVTLVRHHIGQHRRVRKPHPAIPRSAAVLCHYRQPRISCCEWFIEDMAAYDRFLNEKLFTLDGISQVNSNFVLRNIKEETAIPIR